MERRTYSFVHRTGTHSEPHLVGCWPRPHSRCAGYHKIYRLRFENRSAGGKEYEVNEVGWFYFLPSSPPPKKLLLDIQDGEKRDFPLREGSKKKGQARKKRKRKPHLTKVSPSTSNCLFGSLDCVMGGAWTPPTAPVKVCRLLASGGPCLGSSPSLNS